MTVTLRIKEASLLLEFLTLATLHVWLNGEYHGKIEKLQHLDVMFRELE